MRRVHFAAMEETNRGVLLERRAAAREASHASFLLEARFDEAGLVARMMLAAAQSLPALQAGAYSPLDLPLGALWGEQRTAAEMSGCKSPIFCVTKRRAK